MAFKFWGERMVYLLKAINNKWLAIKKKAKASPASHHTKVNYRWLKDFHTKKSKTITFRLRAFRRICVELGRQETHGNIDNCENIILYLFYSKKYRHFKNVTDWLKKNTSKINDQTVNAWYRKNSTNWKQKTIQWENRQVTQRGNTKLK